MNIRNRITDFRMVKASELRPNPRNWRKHPEAQQNALRGILAEVGYVDALLARTLPDGSLELVDGHLRAEMTPEQEVPVLVVDLDEDEAAKVLATFDPLGDMAEMDDEKFADLYAMIETDSEALREMLDGLAEEADAEEGGVECENDAGPQTDRAEELREKWGVEQGQLWLIGEHRLLCGDCRNADDMARLCGSEKINVAFTSPPYASQRKYDESSGFKPIKPDGYVAWWEPVQANVRRHLAGDGSFFVNIKPACEGLERELYVFDLVTTMRRKWKWLFAEEFCWQRTGIPQQVVRRFKNQFEPVYQFSIAEWKIRPEAVRHRSDNVPIAQGAGAGDTNAARRQGKASAVDGNEVAPGLAYPGNRLPVFCESHEALGHSAAFPVGLPSFFIRAFSDEGDVIADPFLGSGTTMVAAQNLHRRCFGIEISPAYCGVILERMATAFPELEVRQA